MQHESYQIYKSFQKDDNIKSQVILRWYETKSDYLGILCLGNVFLLNYYILFVCEFSYTFND